MQQLDPRDSFKRMEEDESFIFIDMRAQTEHSKQSPKGSENFNLDQMKKIRLIYPDIKDDTPIYLLCYLGNTSMIAARNLTNMGLTNVVSINGGYDSWKKNQMPITYGDAMGMEIKDKYIHPKNVFDLLCDKENGEKNIDDLPLEEQVAALKAKIKSSEEQEKLSAQMAMLGEMTAGVIHEINNPLAIVKGKLYVLTHSLAQALKESKTEDDKNKLLNLEKSALKLNSAVERIGAIVATVKAASYNQNLEANDLFIIDDFLEEMLDILQFKTKKIPLSYELTPGCAGKKIKAHKNQLIQVIVNLVNNATDAIEELDLPKPWIKIKCHSCTEEEGKKTIFFSIIDSGEGIPMEVQKNIMKSFFTTKEKGKGTGLGMGVIKKIIQEHGGVFYIDNDNPNTCFTFSITF
jgi:signal transduction histidine kinase/rhodanese-related sulfurtransferase